MHLSDVNPDQRSGLYKPFFEGVTAFDEGEGVGACPYPLAGAEASAWQSGWYWRQAMVRWLA